MADFETMSRNELVDLCAARGLPTYGAKAALADRLRATDEGSQSGSDSTTDAVQADEPAVAEPAAPPRVREFTATYDIDELDDDEHTELCARVVAEAEATGYRTRGGGRRLSGDHRSAKYGVSVR